MQNGEYIYRMIQIKKFFILENTTSIVERYPDRVLLLKI